MQSLAQINTTTAFTQTTGFCLVLLFPNVTVIQIQIFPAIHSIVFIHKFIIYTQIRLLNRINTKPPTDTKAAERIIINIIMSLLCVFANLCATTPRSREGDDVRSLCECVWNELSTQDARPPTGGYFCATKTIKLFSPFDLQKKKKTIRRLENVIFFFKSQSRLGINKQPFVCKSFI